MTYKDKKIVIIDGNTCTSVDKFIYCISKCAYGNLENSIRLYCSKCAICRSLVKKNTPLNMKGK